VELYLRSPYIFMTRCLIKHRMVWYLDKYRNFTYIFVIMVMTAAMGCQVGKRKH